MKTIGIIGARVRETHEDFLKVQNAFLSVYCPGDMVVSGGCPRGGDAFAEKIARSLGIPIVIYPPRWTPWKIEDGKLVKSQSCDRAAGFKRNGLIAQGSDVLIACVAPDRKGGTEDTIQKFRQFKPEGKVILV